MDKELIDIIADFITEDPDIFDEAKGRRTHIDPTGQRHARRGIERSDRRRKLLDALGRISSAIMQRSTVPRKHHERILKQFISDVASGKVEIDERRLERDLVEWLSLEEYFNLSSDAEQRVKDSLGIKR